MSIYKKLLTLSLTTLITLTPVLANKIDYSKIKIYPAAEVVKHNSKKLCWVVIGKYIYDVTKFLADHPGSYKILFKCCGKDCTNYYADKRIGEEHSKKSHKMRDKMIVGILKEKIKE